MRSLWMGTRCCCWMERRVEIWRRRTLTTSNGFDTPSVRSCKRMATSEMEVPVLTPHPYPISLLQPPQTQGADEEEERTARCSGMAPYSEDNGDSTLREPSQL